MTTITNLDNLKAEAEANAEALKSNRYPGRGIIIGMTPDGTRLVQVYWIMGRSENSRNRIFVLEEDGSVRTEARDPAKLTDPSLIIYYPVRQSGGAHIVTNGDQTDTIADAIASGGTFEDALRTRTFEPDAPNFTPRISGIVQPGDKSAAYKLAILKSNRGNEALAQRHFFTYEQPLAGFGHLIHTYQGDGNPLPSFEGEPKLVPLFDDAEQTLEYYWKRLDEENRISLLVKTIPVGGGEAAITIRNKE
ncbi:IMP cyclohydrolase-like protein [Thermobacillus composti KWC4]|uniref:IMP cyclohydrolase-like protein n=1 Tax=Thermobacillus composti (strain DSM 18247 / JCM 13945 / KWC4) TaxID=717605 RepID=L0EHN7_THECK|nr:IMP cyclohydrolase [Thermobacillus composti]AGA59149.1 IMP cyclohydrolase-like protein [Thermobacillus composti KWC4]